MFLVLALGFADVVLKGLLFNLHLDVFLLLSWQVIVHDIRCFALFLQIARILEWGGSFEVGFECTVHVGQLALHAGVPVVLNGIVCSSLENFGDLSPLIVDDSVHQEQNPLLLLAPVNLLDHGVQVVVPALAALLTDAIGKVLSDKGPLLRTVALNELKHSPVLFGGPWSLDGIKF